MIAVIKEKAREIEEGRIIIGINYQEIYKMLIGETKIANQHMKEGIVEVVRIKRL